MTSNFKGKEKRSGRKKKEPHCKGRKPSLTDHSRKYDVISELANKPPGIKLDQLLRGDTVRARKDIERLLTGRMKKKVGVVAFGGEDQGGRKLKAVKVRVYGTEVYAVMDSEAVQNILPKNLMMRLYVLPQETNKTLTVATGNR